MKMNEEINKMRDNINENVDVVIIGSGIMGLSTAYYLAETGFKICIIERENYIGGHTTLRCAGGFRQQFSSSMNITLSILNRRMIKELEKDARCKIPFNSCGYAFAFTKEDSAIQAEKAVKMQKEMSVNVEFLSTKNIKKTFTNMYVDDVLLTTYCRDDGLIDVGALLGVLKRRLDEFGVSILTNKAVCGIETQNGEISKVLLDNGEIKTTIVVNAAGPWAKQIGDMVDVIIPIQPSLQQIWVTEPTSLIKNDMPVIIFEDERIGFHWESGGLLSGYHRPQKQEIITFPEIDLDWEVLHCQKAVERMPKLYEMKLASRWAGFYETTTDDLPIIGSFGPAGMYCIAGFNGHGLMHGLACGYLLSNIITGKSTDVDISTLSLYRFNNKPFVNAEKYII